MKKIWKVLLIVVALLVISFTIASACPPKPVCQEGEIEDAPAEYIPQVRERVCEWRLWHGWLPYQDCHWVVVQQEGWTNPVCHVPVGGCMDELALNYDELAEIDAPEMCEYAEVKQGCAFTMYVLQGNGTCSLTRNYGLEDIPGKIPSRFVQDGKLTAYGQGLCNQCRTTPFKYSGEWTTTCDIPCVDCN